MDLAKLNDGGSLASLKKKKSINPNTNQRPGSGWKEDVPSIQQQQVDSANQQKQAARRNNLQKQMNLAMQRRIQVQTYRQPIKGNSGKSKNKQKKKRPQTPALRREISFPGLPMEDGRPPWRSMANTNLKRPQSASPSKRRNTTRTPLPVKGEGEAEGDVPEVDQLTPIETRTPRSAAEHKRTVARESRMLHLKEKAELLKASLPSYYHPIESYHPEVKEYNPRRRTYDHEYMVMSTTPGPGRYQQAQFGSGIRGGVISESKGKSSIEWVQYYARQIPAPGQYYPVNPNEVSGVSTRIPDFVGKTNLENIIYAAKQLPGPGQYEVIDPVQKGGVISKAKSKSDVDWMVYRASTIPGPQDYPAPPLSKRGGGRFSNAVVPSEVEVLMRRTEQIPGPSDYDLNSMDHLPKGGKFFFVFVFFIGVFIA